MCGLGSMKTLCRDGMKGYEIDEVPARDLVGELVETPQFESERRDVALDSAEVGDGAEGLPCEGRRRGRRLED